MILYCKNIVVYNTDTEEVYNKELLPGLMQKSPCNFTFDTWMRTRYSSNTNTIARKLKGVTFGQGHRVTINKSTFALSLSDCYWVKSLDNPILFEEISPYYNDFWKGQGLYVGGSIPTLYVGGYLTKEWINNLYLYKYGKETLIEIECANLCKLASIPCAEVYPLNNENSIGIAVSNITNPNYMLEQADQSGRLDPDYFTEEDILKLFGIQGLQMLVIDAIVGNGDRHAGNFGWLRDTNTGEYMGMSPLYDFDHALDTELKIDKLITDIIPYLDKPSYKNEVLCISRIVIANAQTNVFKERAKTFIELIEG